MTEENKQQETSAATSWQPFSCNDCSQFSTYMTVTATLELSYKATITPEKTNKRQEKTNKVSRSFQIIIIKM